MSGGSFNYLCFADGPELLEKREDLENMIEALKNWKNCDDPAIDQMIRETKDVLDAIAAVTSAIETVERLANQDLRDAWKGMEWGTSMDGWNRFIDAMKVYDQKVSE